MTSSLPRWLSAGLTTATAGALLAGCGGGDDAATSTPTTAAQGTTAAQDAPAAAATDDDGATKPADAATAASDGTAADGGSAASDDGASSTYADGTYEAEGTYRSPGGNESVGVSLTLKDGTVTAVQVTPESSNPNGKKYQGQFADGIADVVVGKPLDELNVSKVAGSSLTSGGFNEAVERIGADARA